VSSLTEFLTSISKCCSAWTWSPWTWSPWTCVVLAGVCEVLWSVGLKYTVGFTKPLPSVGVGVALAASMWLLSLGVRDLPIGTAYAAWVGIGVIGTTLAAAVLFGEALSLPRVLFLLLLVASIVGLELTSPHRG
jgi:quaternary ammonium compound-resistance protein SugE